MGSHRVRHDWSDLACMHTLEKEMAAHSSVFAWRITGTGEPGGLLSMGRTESDRLKRLSSSSSNSSVSSVAQSCPILWDPMDFSTPGFPVYHQLPEPTQTHVHRVSDASPPTLSSSFNWFSLSSNGCIPPHLRLVHLPLLLALVILHVSA